MSSPPAPNRPPLPGIALDGAIFHILRAMAGRCAPAEPRFGGFGGFDWTKTLAFSEVANTQPGVWVNLEGPEVTDAETASLIYTDEEDDIVAAQLRALTDLE